MNFVMLCFLGLPMKYKIAPFYNRGKIYIIFFVWARTVDPTIKILFNFFGLDQRTYRLLVVVYLEKIILDNEDSGWLAETRFISAVGSERTNQL